MHFKSFTVKAKNRKCEKVAWTTIGLLVQSTFKPDDI